MRTITKDVTFPVDGEERTFRLTKPDAFSGVALLRLLLRLEAAGARPTLLDLVASLSEEELRTVMRSMLNHVEVLLPAGPHPVMTGAEWGWPEIGHDTPACMRLFLEEIAWSLSGFFGGSGSKPEGGPPDTSR